MTIKKLSDYSEGVQEAIKSCLDDINSLFVEWDRVVAKDDNIAIYGWLYNYNKIDFVLVDILIRENECICTYTTSSPKASVMISENTNSKDTPCIRYTSFMGE